MKTIGIITSIIPYSESSLICKVQSREAGHISLIAKGIRKKELTLSRMWEYDFNLLEPKEEGLYLVKEARELKDFSTYPSSGTWAAADCGAELLSHIIIPLPEAQEYYSLLSTYLGYLQGVEKNAVLLLWRLFMRVYRILGINLVLDQCAICGKQREIVARTNSGDLVCTECQSDAGYSSQLFMPQSRKIIRLLPEIGNHLSLLELDRVVVKELNDFFIDYYYAHYKQKLRLKSLSVLCQFYPIA